ncbi:MAG: hypothetical protein HYV18_04725 [Gammaproteobacteria bacterium]|nr:hypothetical protein [Gammaproteobacteria bacterium]
MKGTVAGLRCWLLLAFLGAAEAAEVRVTDAQGQPLAGVMVTRLQEQPSVPDMSDNGYPAAGVAQQSAGELSVFTGAGGRAALDPSAGTKLRLRRPGYRDREIDFAQAAAGPVALERETDPARLAAQQPSDAWVSLLDLGSAADKKEFLLQCGFCHQQGSMFLRRQRSAQEWASAIRRMVGYGARLSTELQEALPARLEAQWQAIHRQPERVPAGAPWGPELAASRITEWPIGDGFSQMHDLLYARSGLVYVGDNLQDRLYEIDPRSGRYTVYRIPAQPGDAKGGLLAGRLREYPKHETYNGIHSLAESPVDGHLFITASYQQRIVEFDPQSKRFAVRQMDRGYYPHTVRVDARDRVWFTLALSNQVAMYERRLDRFTYYDLPPRNLRERLTVSLMGGLLRLMSWGLPIANWMPVDRQSTGVPLPYGIDLTPDGKVWFARLHTDEIGRIDPDSGEVALIRTPFKGPRRLRADAAGNLWIAAFPESQIVRYEPASGRYTPFDLPAVPQGGDTPYALNVDRARNVVWVNGTGSDALYGFDIAAQTWRRFPMPRHVTFTRDVEIAPDGRVFTTNSSFPSWHIEGGQPALIVLEPG